MGAEIVGAGGCGIRSVLRGRGCALSDEVRLLVAGVAFNLLKRAIKTMESDRPSLVIWRFLDGKAGHESQSLGLVKALEVRASVEVLDFPVSQIRYPFLQWLLRSFRAPAEGARPDLLIGAGHRTHWSMLAARRTCGGKTVVLMRPSLPIGWFDYAIIPEHDGPFPRANILMTKGVLNAIRPSANALLDKGLILIGGPSKHHQWDDASIVRQVESLIRKRGEVNWVLTTSRRTPEPTVEKLRDIESGNLEVVPFEETVPGWVGQRLSGCGWVWVTEDSVSMVFEALTSGARVGLFKVPAKAENSRVQAAIIQLKKEGMVASRVGEAPNSREHPCLAEADRVADWLLERHSSNLREG